MFHSFSAFCGLAQSGEVPLNVVNTAVYERYMNLPTTPDTSSEEYCILLNVSQLKQEDVKIFLSRMGEVDIRIRHDARQNSDGSSLSRDCCIIYELPIECRGKRMSAQWSKDDCLLIRATSDDLCEAENLVELTPTSTESLMVKATVNLGFVKSIVEGIRDLAQHTLYYMKFYTGNANNPIGN